MNIKEVTFDNFLSLSIEKQDEILNNPELLKNLIKKNISEHRYRHCLSVAQLCRNLAQYHDVDPDKAYLTGLLHDCCKFPDSNTSGVLEKYLQKYEPEKLNGLCGAYHSWVAPYYLREKLNFKDEEILKAIYNHTILNSADKLSLILYIADKREPLRGIADNILKLAESDLFAAYKLLKKDVENFIKERHERFIDNSL